jgi:3-keto-L-gulonate-6-phosphate decarboxylase
MHGKRKTIVFIIGIWGIWFLFIHDAHAIDSNNVVCVTDKETYQQGEEVMVTITNNSSDEITIVDRKYIDGGFATIEMKYNDGTWHAIELYAAANITSFRTLKKEESHGYIWKTVGYNRMDTVAVTGAYKILFHNGIISNQFFVTDRMRPH